jgi:uncharacterized protein YjbJ (UPF0337 family)
VRVRSDGDVLSRSALRTGDHPEECGLPAFEFAAAAAQGAPAAGDRPIATRPPFSGAFDTDDAARRVRSAPASRGSPNGEPSQVRTRGRVITEEGLDMAIGDKIQNAAEDAAGKGKEAAGKATGDDRLAAEGKGDQAGAKAKKVGEDVKDIFK